MCTNKPLIGGLIEVYFSGIVKWGYQENLKPVLFVLQKSFKRTKTQTKSKATNKTKANKQKQQRLQFFTQKTSKRAKIVCFVVLKKNWNCLNSLIYYTTLIKTYKRNKQDYR